MDFTQNFILKTDSYKLTHWLQYPKDTVKVYSYFESRGGKYNETLFFGLQYFLKQLEGVVVSMEDVQKAQYFSRSHFNSDLFYKDGWEYIVKRHGGKLPIRIKAVKEGSIVPTSNVLFTIENTDDNCFWLTNVLETLLMKVWYPVTIATNSYKIKRIIAKYLLETGSTLDSLPFKLHDFGYRGVSSEETAGIGGMSHLVNFMGTDTLAGIEYANHFYNQSKEYQMYGFSVPASEHSIACSYGKESEEEYFKNMLDSYPTGLVSVVSDTYNVYDFVVNMATKFKEEILKRDGTVVFRPDSGDPVEVNVNLIKHLHMIFEKECTKTATGHILLPPQIRMIQGDGIDGEMVERILYTMKELGYAADNFVFGSGGGLLQKFDRDTQKFAIKASYSESIVNGKRLGKDLQKDPITSSGKKSKPGQLVLVKDGGGYKTLNVKEFDNSTMTDELETVFENGVILREQSFEEIRTLANKYFKTEEV